MKGGWMAGQTPGGGRGSGVVHSYLLGGDWQKRGRRHNSPWSSHLLLSPQCIMRVVCRSDAGSGDSSRRR